MYPEETYLDLRLGVSIECFCFLSFEDISTQKDSNAETKELENLRKMLLLTPFAEASKFAAILFNRQLGLILVRHPC